MYANVVLRAPDVKPVKKHRPDTEVIAVASDDMSVAAASQHQQTGTDTADNPLGQTPFQTRQDRTPLGHNP